MATGLAISVKTASARVLAGEVGGESRLAIAGTSLASSVVDVRLRAAMTKRCALSLIGFSMLFESLFKESVMDWFEQMHESMKKADEYRELREAEHRKMLADGFSGEVKVGDRILVRASMIGPGCGHHWEFREMLVEEVANYAVKAKILNDYIKDRSSFWIGLELITEVIPSAAKVAG